MLLSRESLLRSPILGVGHKRTMLKATAQKDHALDNF